MDIVMELRDEILLDDAYNMADWLENEEITKYLSEGKYISEEIRYSLRYTTCPIVTHLFCAGGNFYMIQINGRSIGYLKLVEKGKDCEIVIVIGDTNNWNKGYGTMALRKAINEAFFNLRYENIVAKIKFGNTASVKIFEHLGFENVCKTNGCDVFKLNVMSFIKKAA